MKKVFLLLLIFPLLQLACDNGGDEFECSSGRYFNITGLELIPSASDENYFTFTLSELDSARFETFYFNGQLKADYYSLVSKPAFSFLPQAYARDIDPCLPGRDGSEEKLAGLYLISLGKYNANIQPGDTLKNNYRINNELPSEYLSKNGQKIKNQQLNITLTERPDPKELQSFKLIYKLTNGETYEVITPRFKLY